MKKQRPYDPAYIKKLTHDSVPASVGLVKEMRREVCARFDSMDARFDSLEARFDGVDARFDSLEARVDGLDTKFTAMIKETEGRLGSQIKAVVVSVHRTHTLMEEQRSENRIVLDGIKNVLERMDRLGADQRDLRKTVSIS